MEMIDLTQNVINMQVCIPLYLPVYLKLQAK
jgi:hypothetical protein